MPSIDHYFFLSFALFLLGVTGAVMRRNALVVLMSVELILNAVNINLVAFSRWFGDASGQAVAILLAVVAFAEAVVGLAIIAAVVRSQDAKSGDEKDMLSW
jgi:NADH-quinone oxidoreductase subunit K